MFPNLLLATGQFSDLRQIHWPDGIARLDCSEENHPVAVNGSSAAAGFSREGDLAGARRIGVEWLGMAGRVVAARGSGDSGFQSGDVRRA